MKKKVESAVNQSHFNLELTDEYKLMMDAMLDDERSGKADYVSFDVIKRRFLANKLPNGI